MNFTRFLLVILPALACIETTHAQTIVNTETLLLSAGEAVQWTAGVSGDFSNGNSNVIDLSLDAGAAWTFGIWTLKGAAAWARLAEDGVDIQANAFGQVRITAGDVAIAQPYAFAQTSRNNILLLNQRTLVGIGVKRRVFSTEAFFLETSLGAFLEHETYTSDIEEPSKETFRNSVILSAGWDVSEAVLLRLTTYAQTVYSDFSDSRIFLECAIDVAVSEQIAIEWNAGFRWDGEPHGGLGSWDLGNTVGLRLGLNE